MRVDINRQPITGSFELSTTTATLPAMEFDWNTPKGFLNILQLNILFLLILAYIIYFFWEIHANRRMQLRDRIMSSAFDFVVMIGMLLGIIMYYNQIHSLMRFSAQPFYNVYDSRSLSPRPLLISRNTTMADLYSNTTDDSQQVLSFHLLCLQVTRSRPLLASIPFVLINV